MFIKTIGPRSDAWSNQPLNWASRVLCEVRLIQLAHESRPAFTS